MAGAGGSTAQRAGDAPVARHQRDRVACARRRALRALPGDFPAWRTVYGWFRRWLGLFGRLLCDVARLRRRAAGRKPEPGLGS